jgi:hypothetical protein
MDLLDPILHVSFLFFSSFPSVLLFSHLTLFFHQPGSSTGIARPDLAPYKDNSRKMGGGQVGRKTNQSTPSRLRDKINASRASTPLSPPKASSYEATPDAKYAPGTTTPPKRHRDQHIIALSLPQYVIVITRRGGLSQRSKKQTGWNEEGRENGEECVGGCSSTCTAGEGRQS